MYTAALEVGGATGASANSITVAPRALPGMGNLIPTFDRINPSENGGWHIVIVTSPLNADIQASQPNLEAQDEPAKDTSPSINNKSRCDLQFGFEISIRSAHSRLLETNAAK